MPVVLTWDSTRVSNELGAGNPQKARIAVYAVVYLAAAEAIVVSTALFASRHVFGYIFSNEEEVVDYVRNLAPFLCLSVILDGLQGVLSGKVPLPRSFSWHPSGHNHSLAIAHSLLKRRA